MAKDEKPLAVPKKDFDTVLQKLIERKPLKRQDEKHPKYKRPVIEPKPQK